MGLLSLLALHEEWVDVRCVATFCHHCVVGSVEMGVINDYSKGSLPRLSVRTELGHILFNKDVASLCPQKGQRRAGVCSVLLYLQMIQL